MGTERLPKLVCLRVNFNLETALLDSWIFKALLLDHGFAASLSFLWSLLKNLTQINIGLFIKLSKKIALVQMRFLSASKFRTMQPPASWQKMVRVRPLLMSRARKNVKIFWQFFTKMNILEIFPKKRNAFRDAFLWTAFLQFFEAQCAKILKVPGKNAIENG